MYPDDGCSLLDVRLSFRERGGATGNLEVCSGGEWQFVCGSLLGVDELDVICRSLGFDEFEQSSGFVSLAEGSIVDETLDEILQFVDCTGEEQALSQCLIPQRKRRNVCELPNPRITCQCEWWWCGGQINFTPPLESRLCCSEVLLSFLPFFMPQI